MDFKLGRTESINQAFRRIGAEVIAQIRAGVASADDTGIHEARKGCKWLRATLRLLRTGLKADATASEARRIRRFARMLGNVRDATIRLVSFRTLDLQDFDELERRLEKEAGAEHHHHLNLEGQRKANRSIDALEKGWMGLRLSRGGWQHLERGIERSYRRACKGLRRMDEDPTDEIIHEWRKRVKDLMYHVRLLGSIKPNKMKRLEGKLQDLSDWLGYDHDLVVLRAYVDAGQALPESDRERLHDEIKKRRKEHLTAARHVADVVFQDTPREFTRTLEQWWNNWQG
jgi:CHAD domain-containing protein